MKLSANLDANKLAIIQAVMHPVTSNPTTPVDGQVWYRTDTDRIMCQVNGVAQSLAFVSELGGGVSASYTVQGIVELATAAETTTGTDVTRALTPEGLASMVDLTAMDWFIDEDSMATNSALRTPSQQSVKAYVDAQVSSSLTYMGGYNAATDTPSLDDGTPVAGILVGDTYTVTAAGTFFTEEVEVGDTLIAEINSALVLADWTIVNRNIGAASATVSGVVELATAAEVDTGTDTTRAITPEALASSGYPRAFSATLGDGATNPITVTHSLGTKDVVVALRQVSDDVHVLADITSSTVNAIILTFGVVPTSNQYRVTVIG